MAESCKVLGEIVLNILANLKGRQDVDIVVNAALQKLEEVAALGDSISVSLLGQKVRISVGISRSHAQVVFSSRETWTRCSRTKWRAWTRR